MCVCVWIEIADSQYARTHKFTSYSQVDQCHRVLITAIRMKIPPAGVVGDQIVHASGGLKSQ